MKLKLLALLALLGCVTTAFSQSSPTYAAQTLTSTATVAASTATNIAAVIDCRKQSTVTLQVSIKNDAASSTVITLPYQRSVDGVTYVSALNVAAFTVASVTQTTFNTNLSTLGAGFIKIPYATNDHGTVNCTNLTLSYAIKIQAP